MAIQKESVSTDVSAARVAEINRLHRDFVKILKKGAMTAFEIGKSLSDVKYRTLDASDSWPQWCKDNLDFDEDTANRYLRVYENFKDNPKLLIGQTIFGALKSISAPQQEKQGRVEYGNPDKQYEFPWEYAFEKPPLSKAKLKNYRFEIPSNHDIYLIRRGFNAPIKIVDLLTSDPEENLKTVYRGMMETIQRALEMYFQEVERIESLQEEK
ncbi:MAG: DUF3102 domain-containing protein [Treponema sp.]|nr:DUF3102 domain-containing protein [Treponema sp.]